MKELVRGCTETFLLETPKPKLEAVLRIQGYKDPAKVRRVIQGTAQTAIDVFKEIATPTISYRIVDIRSVDESELQLGENVRLQSRIFGQYLREASEVVVFALTVGKGIDEQTIEWMDQEKLVEALFLESAAWLGVEYATREFVLILRNWTLQQKFRISRRLGPGYTYPINGQQVQWNLEDQKPLFELFEDADIPIKLLESAAMLPKMSRSGIFGLIPR